MLANITLNFDQAVLTSPQHLQIEMKQQQLGSRPSGSNGIRQGSVSSPEVIIKPGVSAIPVTETGRHVDLASAAPS